eukprot:jgi/Mesen1/5857/ME000298S05118
MEDSDFGQILANFIDITGANDDVAMQMLQATDFKLEEAVQLFFAGGHDAAPPVTATSSQAANQGYLPDQYPPAR